MEASPMSDPATVTDATSIVDSSTPTRHTTGDGCGLCSGLTNSDPSHAPVSPDNGRWRPQCGCCTAVIPDGAPLALQYRYRHPGALVSHRTTACLSCAAAWVATARPWAEHCPHCHRTVYRGRRLGTRL